MTMRIISSSRFLRSFDKLSPDVQEEFNQRLRLFQDNPFDPTLRTHKLSGILKGLWSFSVTQKHRVIFRFANDAVEFIDIGSHDVYR